MKNKFKRSLIALALQMSVIWNFLDTPLWERYNEHKRMRLVRRACHRR